MTACDIKTSQHQNVIYVKFSTLPPSGSCRSAIGGPLASSAGRLRHLQRGPRLPWMRGVRVRDGGEGNRHTNETSLSVCGLHRPTKKKFKKKCEHRAEKPKLHECVLHVPPHSVWECVTFMSVCGEMGDGGTGGVSTAATSSDSDVTVRSGLRRQCG